MRTTCLAVDGIKHPVAISLRVFRGGDMLFPEMLGFFVILTAVVLPDVNAYAPPMSIPLNGAHFIQSLNTGLQSKIVSGNDANENEYPFIVYTIDDQERHYCTGSLIDRRWVLTAAHCLTIGATQVVLGVYDRSTNTSSSKQVIDIAEEIRHPAYNYSIKVSDIGLIKLSRSANIRSEAVSRVAIVKSEAHKAQFLANEKVCKTLGWGIVLNDKVWSIATRLQKLETRYVNDSEIQRLGFPVYPHVLYYEAVYKPGDECRRGQSCNGDSGGPVVCRKGGSWMVVAVTSFGYNVDGCITGVAGQTDVLQHVSWIESVLSKKT